MDTVTGDAWGDELVESMRDESRKTRVSVLASSEQLPLPKNRISLNHDKTDIHGNPVPDVSFTTGTRARRSLEYASGILRDIMRELDASDVTIENPQTPRHASHHMGTTRMGTDPEKSVVDSRLRTHDLRNLSIASSSLFVTAGAMNPTLTIAALALKTAAHIEADL